MRAAALLVVFVQLCACGGGSGASGPSGPAETGAFEHPDLGNVTSVVPIPRGGYAVVSYRDRSILEVVRPGDQYSAVHYDAGFFVVQAAGTQDDLILSGGIESVQPGGIDQILAKVDGFGSYIWQYRYSFQPDAHYRVMVASDGGLLVVMSQGGIVRLDRAGQVMWARQLGAAQVVGTTSDGGCLVAGYTEDGGGLLAKLDVAGAVVWSREIPHAPDIAEELAGGDCVFAGVQYAVGADPGGTFAGRITSSGATVWYRLYQSPQGVDPLSRGGVTNDGGLVIKTDSGIVFRVDANGVMLWQKAYPQDGNYIGVHQADDGTLVGGSGTLVFRMDRDGGIDCSLPGIGDEVAAGSVLVGHDAPLVTLDGSLTATPITVTATATAVTATSVSNDPASVVGLCQGMEPAPDAGPADAGQPDAQPPADG